MKLTGSEAAEIVWCNNDDWKQIEETLKVIYHSNWSVCKRAVFLHIPSGKYYQFDWSQGAAETQHKYPFEEEEYYEPTEVHLVEKLVKVWEDVEDGN